MPSGARLRGRVTFLAFLVPSRTSLREYGDYARQVQAAVERINADGSVQTSLDEARVKAELIPALKAGGYRAIAVCLLNAYANPAHEKRLAALITAALPEVLVTCSHQVAREFREFERASTTLLSAYVQPVIDGYLHRFENKLAGAGFKGRFTVMQSNGGRLPAEAMRTSAITALY